MLAYMMICTACFVSMLGMGIMSLRHKEILAALVCFLVASWVVGMVWMTLKGGRH